MERARRRGVGRVGGGGFLQRRPGGGVGRALLQHGLLDPLLDLRLDGFLFDAHGRLGARPAEAPGVVEFVGQHLQRRTRLVEALVLDHPHITCGAFKSQPLLRESQEIVHGFLRFFGVQPEEQPRRVGRRVRCRLLIVQHVVRVLGDGAISQH